MILIHVIPVMINSFLKFYENEKSESEKKLKLR